MKSKAFCVVGIVVEIGFARAQWPGFEGVADLPCVSSCFVSAASDISSICATNPTPTSSNTDIYSLLPSCLSTACPHSEYSSLITKFPTSYPTPICQAWPGFLSTASNPWSWTGTWGSSASTCNTCSSLGTWTTTAAAGSTATGATSTDDSAEVLVTSVISGSVIVSTATNAASASTSIFASRSRSLNSFYALVGFLSTILATV